MRVEETPRAQFSPPHCAGHGGHHPHPGDPVWHPTLFGVLRALYLPQKLLTPGQFLDTAMSGFKSMIGVLAIVTCAFMLRDINSLLGMPEFVIGAAKAAMSPQVLPVAAF